jgi:hypothetical protein
MSKVYGVYKEYYYVGAPAHFARNAGIIRLFDTVDKANQFICERIKSDREKLFNPDWGYIVDESSDMHDEICDGLHRQYSYTTDDISTVHHYYYCKSMDVE